ncbi:MAG: hypothetical protein U0L49_09045 [Eubacterium sp.]|nr:hypothetical protein [Eubacterium sp.]
MFFWKKRKRKSEISDTDIEENLVDEKAESTEPAGRQSFDPNDSELRRLSRSELLELLVELSREKDRLQEKVDQLQTELAQAEEKLSDRNVRMDRAGNLAEASLAMNDIFAKAQQTADDYIAAVKANVQNIKERERQDAERDRKKAEQYWQDNLEGYFKETK